MDNKKKEDINAFRVIINYQINEVFSLIKHFFFASLWCLPLIGFFYFIDIIIKFIFYLVNQIFLIFFEDSFNILKNNFHGDKSFLDFGLRDLLQIDRIIFIDFNMLSNNFFLGKFGFWGTIIFILLIVLAKFDEDWFKNNSLTLKVPVWGWKKIIFLSIFFILLGFILDFLPMYLIAYILLVMVGTVIRLIKDETFRKVAKRVYPDLDDDEKLHF